MQHYIAKHYLKDIRITLNDFQTNCSINKEHHLLTLNNQYIFPIPFEVFEDLVEMEKELVH